MKILSIDPVVSVIVETDQHLWSTYRRNGRDCWEQLMGESWESVYGKEANELEAEYQKYQKPTKEIELSI